MNKMDEAKRKAISKAIKSINLIIEFCQQLKSAAQDDSGISDQINSLVMIRALDLFIGIEEGLPKWSMIIADELTDSYEKSKIKTKSFN